MNSSALTQMEHVRAARDGTGIYAASIFLGSFLLFAVQPMAGKFILPWFGGSPAVWTACMLFFQSMLLAGYAYAHGIVMRLRPDWQAGIHLIALALATASLPMMWLYPFPPVSGAQPAAWIVLFLLGFVGLPYLVLAANGPLMQAWASRASPSRSPYRLYALSNVASLMALLAYTTLIEPLLTRRQQTLAWASAFVVFALCCSISAAGQRRRKGEPERGESRETEARPSPGRYLLWLLLPACASLLLLAVTSKICQDVAVVPFLWVLPLAIYLLSFILCFESQRWYHRSVFAMALVPSLAAVCWALLREEAGVPLLQQLMAYNLVLFVCCMICHGELARLRPAPRGLTGYYLLIATGGALGGVLAAVVAPMLLDGYFELHFALVGCCILLAVVLASDPGSRLHWGRPVWAWFCIALLITLLSLTLWQHAQLTRKGRITGERNFHGVLSLCRTDLPEGPMLKMQHGRIIHGAQYLDERKRVPTTYFGTGSGVGRVLRATEDRGPRRIGIIGLGAGTLAAYGRPGDVLRFYEINPAVVRLARSHFSFLEECQGKVDVVVSDARVALENEPAGGFDLLVLDAFSGDAIPVHLLTREAFSLYRRHLRAGGIIAAHISNRHLDLAPVVFRQAGDLGFAAALYGEEEDLSKAQYRSDWVILAEDAAILQHPLLAGPGRKAAPAHLNGPWTDDRASLWRALR